MAGQGINSFLSSEAKCEIWGLKLHLLPYTVCVSSKGYQTVQMRRLVLVFVSSLSRMYQNLKSWLI